MEEERQIIEAIRASRAFVLSMGGQEAHPALQIAVQEEAAKRSTEATRPPPITAQSVSRRPEKTIKS